NPKEAAPKETTIPKESFDLAVDAAGAVRDAERAFSGHHFDDAETKYKQALKKDPKNIRLLANLAATQLAMEHADDAEQTVKHALEIDGNDAFNLLIMG